MHSGFLVVSAFMLMMAVTSFVFRHQLVRAQQESYRKYWWSRSPPPSVRSSQIAMWLTITFSLLGAVIFGILGLLGGGE